MTLKDYVVKHHTEIRHLAKVAKIGYSTLHMKIQNKRAFSEKDLKKIQQALIKINNASLEDIQKISLK